MSSNKVSLVLSSGGARGIAHISVIESLLDDGYEIVEVSGTSIGSLVAAFFACGKLDLFKNWVLFQNTYEKNSQKRKVFFWEE